MKKILKIIGVISFIFFTYFLIPKTLKSEITGNCETCHNAHNPGPNQAHSTIMSSCASCHGFGGPALYTPTEFCKTCHPSGHGGTQSDTTPPLTSANPIGTLNNNGQYISDVTVELSATDSESGIREIHYAINSGMETIISGNYASISLTTNGDYNIVFFAIDNNGNQEPPNSITVTINKEQNPNLAELHHGLPYLCSSCHDFQNQGPVLCSNCHNVTPDTTPPLTSANPAGTLGNNGQYISDVTVELNASDSGSGVKEIRYSINNGSETTVSGNQTLITLTSDGTYTISYYALDNANNQEQTNSLTIVINKPSTEDTTPPVTTANPIGTLGNDGRYVSDVTVELTAVDAHSGVKEIRYSVDGGQETVFIPDNSSVIFGNYKLGAPVSLGSNINSSYNDGHPSLTADGNTMYFQSNRPGGYGYYDIYVSHKVNGEWQPAENLGAPINTFGDEGGPAVTPDGNVLYFAAGGRGNGDVPYRWTRIWKSVKINGVWQEPVVLSGNVNVSSINNNTGFVTSDGKWLYWNSFDAGYGMWDAFRSDISNGEPLPAEILPSPVNGEYRDGPVYLTADGKYFVSWSDREAFGITSKHYVSNLINGNYESFMELIYPFEEAFALGTFAENETIAYLGSGQAREGMGGDDIFCAPVTRGSSVASFNITSNGEHNVTYYSIDNAGNQETAKTLDININKAVEDTTPPVTTAGLSGTTGDDDWYISDVEIKFSASDSLSGVKEIHYSLDDGEEVVYIPDNSSAVFGDYRFGTPVSLGPNINTPYNDFHPSLTADGNTMYFQSNRPEGYGYSDIYVSHKVNGVWQPAENLGAPINTTGDEGEPAISPDGKVLYFTAGGRGAGDVPYRYTRIWKSVNINGVWQVPTVLPSSVNRSSINNNLSFITQDGKWLYFALFESPDGYGAWDAFRAEILDNGENFTVEHLPSPINTGHRDGPVYLTSDYRYLIFWSDRTGIFPHYVSEVINGIYQNPSRLIYPFSQPYALGTLTENETMAYLVSFQSADYLHASDPGNDIFYAPVIKGSFTSVILATDGIHNITYYAVDNAGNQEQANTLTVRINKSAPVTSADINGIQGNNYWYISNVTINLTANGSLSGIKEIHYSLNGGAEIIETGNQTSINLNADGIYNVSYYAISNSGKQEEVKSVVVNIDKTPPAITASVSPGPNANGWNNTNVTVTFNATDTMSGIFTSTLPVTITEEGTNLIVTGETMDLAGNTSNISVTLNVDKTPPVISASVAPEPNVNGWNNSDVTVTFNGADNLSGIAAVTLPVALTTEGINQMVNGEATDLAGNNASVSVALNIDKTPPSVNAGNDTTFVETETVILPIPQVNDNLDADPMITNDAPSSYPVGYTTVTVTATDKAGNPGNDSLIVTVLTVEQVNNQLKIMINGLNSSAFRSNAGNMKNALTNKINALINIIGAAKASMNPATQDSLFNEAIDKLRNDIQSKMNGCGTNTDNNDWIVDCNAQLQLNELINKIMAALINLKNL